MTDITDQELRDAIEWGRRNEYSGDPAEANAAIVILATVDAPAPTLAEEWRDMLEKQDAGEVVSFSGLLARAEQMEHDLTEARAEVERLTAERDSYERMYLESRTEATALAEELAGAETDVERLTAERDRIANGRIVTYAEVDGKTVQKGAESSAETPEPADVKPGEAWIVEVERFRSVATKDASHDLPWCVLSEDILTNFADNSDVTLISRLVPAPRVITNPDELDRLAEGSVILAQGDPFSYRHARWYSESMTLTSTGLITYAETVTVLWEPEATV